MKKILLILLFPILSQAQTHWVTMYWGAWTQGTADPSNIDFSVATHWIIFSYEPSGQTWSGVANGITASIASDFADSAHAAGKKAIIGTGGVGADYTTCVNSQAHRDTSIRNLMNLVRTYGYDGVDLDWEPVAEAQITNYQTFVAALKDSILANDADGLLVTAVMADDYATVDIQSEFNQINLMTYDLSGCWGGWPSWHNDPIRRTGYVFPSTQAPVPCIEDYIDTFVGLGVPKSKLGFGIDFYGYHWTGVSMPRREGCTGNTGNISYADLMDDYSGYGVQWDDSAGAAWIGWSGHFVSLDVETTMYAKATFMQSDSVGGVIVWEYSGGIRNSQGNPQALHDALKAAFLTDGEPPPDSGYVRRILTRR